MAQPGKKGSLHVLLMLLLLLLLLMLMLADQTKKILDGRLKISCIKYKVKFPTKIEWVFCCSGMVAT